MDNNNLHFQDSGTSFTSPPPPPPPPLMGAGNQPGSGSASNSAIWALVLGISSFVCSLGLFTGIPAWIVGSKEIKAIEAGRSDPAGKVMAQIGMWLGIITTILSVLGLIALILYFIFILGFLGVLVTSG
jgi:hypothetical protein